MRWAQLTLVEDDPGKFDIALLARLLRAHALGRRLPERRRLRRVLSDRGSRSTTAAPGSASATSSASSSPAAASSAWWSSRAPIRTPPTTTSQAAHPDWIAVDAAGKPRRHWASPEMWVTCGLGPYNFEFMTEVTKEIVSRYRVDGIFINRWTGSGMCYCEHCRRISARRPATSCRGSRPRRPRAATPTTCSGGSSGSSICGSSGTPRSARSIPTPASFPNTGGGATSPLDMKKIGERAAMLVADRQARSGLHAAVGDRQEREGVSRRRSGASRSSASSASASRSPIAGRTRSRATPRSGSGWRTSSRTGCGRGSRNSRERSTTRAGSSRSRSSTSGATAPSATCATSGRSPASGSSTRSRRAWFYGGDRVRERVEDPALGWYQALVEARIPFEMVHDHQLDAASLAPLPHAGAAERRRALRCAVRAAPGVRAQRGGGLVATCETSLCDERGAARKDFGLADLFGVSFVRRVPGPGPQRLPAPRARDGRRPPAARRPRGRPAHHPRRLAPRREAEPAVPEPAGHADPGLSRPADGEGLRAPAEDRHPAGVSARVRGRAASPTSRGTSTARSGRCWRPTT